MKVCPRKNVVSHEKLRFQQIVFFSFLGPSMTQQPEAQPRSNTDESGNFEDSYGPARKRTKLDNSSPNQASSTMQAPTNTNSFSSGISPINLQNSNFNDLLLSAPKATLVKSKAEGEIKGQIKNSLGENDNTGNPVLTDQFQCESHALKNQLIPSTIQQHNPQHNSATIPALLPPDQFFNPPQFWNSLPPDQPISHEQMTAVSEEIESYQPYAWYVETV